MVADADHVSRPEEVHGHLLCGHAPRATMRPSCVHLGAARPQGPVYQQPGKDSANEGSRLPTSAATNDRPVGAVAREVMSWLGRL
jgi:hypothetical protein